MLAAVRSAAVLGIDAYDVTVEVDAALGLPQWTIVGLAAGAVKESRAPLAMRPGLVLATEEGHPTAECEAVLRHGAALPLGA